MPAPLTHDLLLMWDNLGLEYCEDMTKREQHMMWNELKGQAPTLGKYPSLNALVLRARFNPQRHYEIYAITVDAGVTVEDMRAQFEQAPQAMADLVRARGRQLYSDRLNKKAVIQ